MERVFLVLSAANGFLAVALGAFGAHGLRARLAEHGDAARRLEWWQTAAHYHLAHALALAVAAYVAAKAPTVAVKIAGGAFAAGILVFCGSLYTMTLTGLRALGAITPIGGLSFLVGWVGVLVAALAIEG